MESWETIHHHREIVIEEIVFRRDLINQKTKFRVAMCGVALLVAILGLFALTSTVSAVDPAPTAIIQLTEAAEVLDGPNGKPTGEVVTGSQIIDLYSTVDIQNNANPHDDWIYLRIGDGTHSFHPRWDEAERWIIWPGSSVIPLPEVYKLTQMTIDSNGLKIVEQGISTTINTGSFLMEGDLNWTARPQYLTQVQLPAGRNDLLISSAASGTECTASFNGVTAVITYTNTPVSGNVVVEKGTCAVWSSTSTETSIVGTHRSFSKRISQANVNIGIVSVFLGLVLFYKMKREGKLRLNLFGVGKIGLTILIAGITFLMGFGTVLAQPPQPQGTPAGPTPPPQETPSVEQPTPAATNEGSSSQPTQIGRTLQSANVIEGRLVLLWTDGEVQDLGNVVGPKGDPGTNGTNGINGTNGTAPSLEEILVAMPTPQPATGPTAEEVANTLANNPAFIASTKGDIGPQGPAGGWLSMVAMGISVLVALTVVGLSVWTYRQKNSEIETTTPEGIVSEVVSDRDALEALARGLGPRLPALDLGELTQEVLLRMPPPPATEVDLDRLVAQLLTDGRLEQKIVEAVANATPPTPKRAKLG